MDIFGFLNKTLEPISRVIDAVHTSEDERGQLRNQLVVVQNQLSGQLLQYEAAILQSKAQIITAEAQGQSWLQRNWRPIAMMTFLVLVVCDSFGLLAFRLSEEAWKLLQIGLGGYVVGRSAEKIAPQLKDLIGGGK